MDESIVREIFLNMLHEPTINFINGKRFIFREVGKSQILSYCQRKIRITFIVKQNSKSILQN